jgi:hypothetical protein
MKLHSALTPQKWKLRVQKAFVLLKQVALEDKIPQLLQHAVLWVRKHFH